MDNQQLPPTPEVPQPQQPVSSSTSYINYNYQQPKKSKKKIIIFSVLVLFFVLLFSGVAYGYFVYLPQRPEMILKKSVENFQQKPEQYKLTGRIDQGDANVPDFDYSVELDGNGNALATVNVQTFLANPTVSVMIVNGKTFAKAENFENSKSLAKRYTNLAGKGIQEDMAEFVDDAGLYKQQGKWIEIPSFLFSRPGGSGGVTESNSVNAQLIEVGQQESKDGKQLQKYTVTMTGEELIEQLANFGGVSAFSELKNAIESLKFNGSDELNLNVWVDTKAKVFERIEYSGRPFEDATFGLNIQRQAVTISAPEAKTLTKTLSYGIVRSSLIRAEFQTGGSANDRQRIADLKAMKLAFEIYKAKNGFYPDRYSIAVQQENFLNSEMKGVDHRVFIDPAGRRTGLNGSQYAYVPSTKNNNESCGPNNGPKCEKFFLITTLDDGSEYQLNSD